MRYIYVCILRIFIPIEILKFITTLLEDNTLCVISNRMKTYVGKFKIYNPIQQT